MSGAWPVHECFMSERRLERRQLDRHRGPSAVGVLRADRAAVGFDDRAGDREPESRSLPAPGGIGAVEALEDPVLAAFRQPRSGIADLDPGPAILLRDRDRDRRLAVTER